MPAHATSVGKAWLATLERAHLYELYPDEHLPQVTPQPVATRSELEDVLAVVRKAGSATNEGESESGIGSVGMVVRDSRATARAALSVAAPLSRLTPARHRLLAGALQDVAERLESRLT